MIFKLLITERATPLACIPKDLNTFPYFAYKKIKSNIMVLIVAKKSVSRKTESGPLRSVNFLSVNLEL